MSFIGLARASYASGEILEIDLFKIPSAALDIVDDVW